MSDSEKYHGDEMFEKYGEDYGLSLDEHNVVYGFAYRKGHGSGEHEVEIEYKEAAELAANLAALRKGDH
jgi:hypothetical protein